MVQVHPADVQDRDGAPAAGAPRCAAAWTACGDELQIISASSSSRRNNGLQATTCHRNVHQG